MIKEKCTDKIKEISINVVQTEIESIRKKDITKTGLRIYKDGYIGVSGGLGKIDEKDMERKAKENLNLHIPYPCEASRDHIEEVDNAANSLSDEEFVDEMEEVLILLKKKYDDFIFSNQMRMVEVENRLLNDVGLNLTYKDKTVEITLLIKEKNFRQYF
jgi:PmbA protein